MVLILGQRSDPRTGPQGDPQGDPPADQREDLWGGRRRDPHLDRRYRTVLTVKTLVAARPVAATYARVTVTATTSAQGISSASSDLTLNRCRAALAVADEVSIAMH